MAGVSGEGRPCQLLRVIFVVGVWGSLRVSQNGSAASKLSSQIVDEMSAVSVSLLVRCISHLGRHILEFSCSMHPGVRGNDPPAWINGELGGSGVKGNMGGGDGVRNVLSILRRNRLSVVLWRPKHVAAAS